MGVEDKRCERERKRHRGGDRDVENDSTEKQKQQERRLVGGIMKGVFVPVLVQIPHCHRSGGCFGGKRSFVR